MYQTKALNLNAANILLDLNFAIFYQAFFVKYMTLNFGNFSV